MTIPSPPNNSGRRWFMKFLGATTFAGGASLLKASDRSPQSSARPAETADLQADVLIVGAGAAGLCAAIRTADHGVSVIVADANYDIGGHAILSGGNVTLGGGTAQQAKWGINDSPEVLFRDLIDWSVVEKNGFPDYRYNDRGLQRAIADNMVATYDLLVANGVEFVDEPPDNVGAHATGISARRQHHAVWKDGVSLESPAGAHGTSIMRALEASARSKGVRFLLNYRLDTIVREEGRAGRVTGAIFESSPTILPGTTTPLQSFRQNGNITATQPRLHVRATRAVIVCTGGHTGNVEFRRIFDPRLTAEYASAGEEYSPQDAAGEIASMAVGASLWGTANQSMERNGTIRRRRLIGTRTNYIRWTPDSPIFAKVTATGLWVRDWNNVVVVNQAGCRFFNELGEGHPEGSAEGFYADGYVPGDWRNAGKVDFRPSNYVDAALAINEGSRHPEYSAGPQWAIFDANAVQREGWDPNAPNIHPDYFFSADSLEELAIGINRCPYQTVPMEPRRLRQEIERFNSHVDSGRDPDFDRPHPVHRIDTAPYYAAWTSVVVHDSHAGLRIDERCRVLDIGGRVIPGLLCAGESAGGSSQHGLGRCFTQGYIAAETAST